MRAHNRSLRSCLIMLITQLASCIVNNFNPDYPREWGAAIPDRIGICPIINGTYSNKGELAIETGSACAEGAISPNESCSLLISANFDQGLSAPIISLEQPDAETLEIAGIQQGNIATNKQVLHRGKDFQCDNDSLFVSDTKSLLGGPGMTAVGILFLSGGVNHYSRAFSRTVDGDLVMTARTRETLYHMIFGATVSATSYVRWHSAKPGEAPF